MRYRKRQVFASLTPSEPYRPKKRDSSEIRRLTTKDFHPRQKKGLSAAIKVVDAKTGEIREVAKPTEAGSYKFLETFQPEAADWMSLGTEVTHERVTFLVSSF